MSNKKPVHCYGSAAAATRLGPLSTPAVVPRVTRG
jgi:hypothetical protein